ncbi:MAG: uracil-DNA glycosylase [Gaiellales bacterium]|jgi:DNA polymerase|nr:uracil-DNA glycosylase [Gaiellales bacterium]
MATPTHDGYPGAEAFLPDTCDLASLRRAAESCRGCDLWESSTQVVFGEGPADAEIVLVGEQPGDREDAEGHPFVGPAGRVLDDALEAAGIERSRVYLTNAVKHFKWEARGTRRLHKKPSRWEVVACVPWLTSELAALTPRVLVLMGATAAQALLGTGFSVMKQRGRVPDDPAGLVTVATVHPSSILRVPPEQRREQMRAFVTDLRLAAELAGA